MAPRASPGGSRVTAAELAAARRDLGRLGIGWAIVWQPGDRAVLRYLDATGFRFAYRADGAAVYRLPPLRLPG